ncbi:IS30 family transposase [Paenibacillus glacialis]|uniref:Integrase n=1 Tax=Paenibacillus glacialis TaxID=494026 RepID=A0A168KE08_9BACL|nr:IS30 family transposase [Paenibacillus glacialis]OAB41889.1 integrase [Paenibacillus glacialis]
MGYTHLNITERSQLEILLRLGWSDREIDKELGRHHSTIARERNRGSSSEKYTAEIAQATYIQRRVSCKAKGKFTPELASELEANQQQTWSPEQIAEHRRVNGKSFVCFKTIYRWLYARLLVAGEVKALRHKGKRRKRESFGHWELDTVVSSRGKSRACAATFIERKTRMYLALKMPDRTAHSMEIAFGVIASQYPQNTFLTATADRGKEFACYNALETFHGLDVYFADPYSSWQRGSNENGNGLLREFFPKGHDFAQVIDEELAHAINLINDRPRKCLGWKSAHESFMEQVSHLA